MSAEQLEFQLRNNVKKPLQNPDELAFSLMREAFEDGMADYVVEKEGVDWLLKRFEIDRERHPRTPQLETWETRLCSSSN